MSLSPEHLNALQNLSDRAVRACVAGGSFGESYLNVEIEHHPNGVLTVKLKVSRVEPTFEVRAAEYASDYKQMMQYLMGRLRRDLSDKTLGAIVADANLQ